MECIAFKGRYKYQLKDAYTVNIEIRPEQPTQTGYVHLSEKGELSIREGYAWDGPSGPTIDTLNFMRGSLVHDALYQLMRDANLDRTTYRIEADKILRDLCREDGMFVLRAWWVYLAVRVFGGPAADPALKHPVIWAPKGCANNNRRTHQHQGV